jgi:hypothetical protein
VADSSASDKNGEFDVPEQVRATANLFSAGRDELAQPGGGGGGGFPPVWELPPGNDRVVMFPSVTGEVNPIAGQVDYNGPEGDGRGPTDVNSYEGISGLVHGGNGMFLAGVFLSDDPPSEPSPERLDFTKNEDFDELAPEIEHLLHALTRDAKRPGQLRLVGARFVRCTTSRARRTSA